LFPFELNFLIWFLLLLAHKDQIAYKHQRKIAAFIGLNFNLIVFLLHAMVGISDSGASFASQELARNLEKYTFHM